MGVFYNSGTQVGIWVVIFCHVGARCNVPLPSEPQMPMIKLMDYDEPHIPPLKRMSEGQGG